MIIQCERCNRKFKIDDSVIKPPGNRVRCSKCGNTFFVEKKEEKSDTEFSTRPERTHVHSDSVSVEKSFESESLPPKAEEVEASFESRSFSPNVEEPRIEKEVTPQERKEAPADPSWSQKDLEAGVKKEPTNGINWEEFVSITKAKAEEEEPDLQAQKDSGLQERQEDSAFNWAKLTIDLETEEPLTDHPELFEETPDEAEGVSPKGRVPVQNIRVEPEVPTKSTSDTLTLDSEKVFVTKRESSRSPFYESNYPSYTSKGVPQRKGGLGGRVIKKFASVVFTLLVLAVIIGAGIMILANQGLIPQEEVSKVSGSILSKLPVKFDQNPGKDVIVSDHSGRWVSTRNGLVYVVSGNITNQSKGVINHVKMKSEFTSAGEKLFEQAFYAGNTLTEDELKTLTVEDVLLKLNRKNGDIDFDNTKKLAGLNYGIEPGESVPFFTIFPSESRILGLKYKINVEDFERAGLK